LPWYSIFSPANRQFDDLHRFFHPGEWRPERTALQPFDYLRTARTEAQDEAIVAD